MLTLDGPCEHQSCTFPRALRPSADNGCHSCIMRRCLLLLLSVLLANVPCIPADSFDLPPFTAVHIQDLPHDTATILITPSPDGSFSLVATQKGLAFQVTPDGVLQLSQAVPMQSLSGLIDDLLHLDDPDAPANEGGTVYIQAGGRIDTLWSEAGNDVVLGGAFTSSGFGAKLTGTGKLIVLNVSSPVTSAWNTG